MAGAYSALTDTELRTRVSRLTDFLDVWGDLTVLTVGELTPRQLVEFSLEAPGYELPTEVKVRYREYYLRGKAGSWDIAKYTYEYFHVAQGARLGYHLHDIGSSVMVPHAHCGSASALEEAEGPHHLRALEYELREVHTQFMHLYAADEPPDCSAFLPLEINRTES